MKPVHPLAVLALLLVAPLAAAQIAVPAERSVTFPGDPGKPMPVGGVLVDLRIETVDNDRVPLALPWLLVGYDNVVNVTVHNGGSAAWNGTLGVNVTGATASEDALSFDVPPNAARSRLLALHPDDAGLVTLALASEDAFQPDGTPVSGAMEGPAVLAPSVTFLDPPLLGGGDDEFDTHSMYGLARPPTTAFARVTPGDTLRPRLQVRNDLPLATAPFRLSLEGSKTVGPVDVRSLEPGESITVELPEFTPLDSQPGGGGRYFGPMGHLDLRATGEFTLAGATVRAHLGQYRIERGAVTDLIPGQAFVEIQDGLALELLTPRDPRLGVPTRVKINASNLGRTDATGTLLVTLGTPNNLYYEVQGPESRSIRIDLAPGEQVSETIEFTPRVTGQWTLGTVFRSSEGFGYGGGGGAFNVKGPLTIRFDRFGTEYARIRERVEIGLTVDTQETLQDAQLRVASGNSYGNPYALTTGGGGQSRPGLVQRLLDVETTTADLGTLRPGGAVNVTLEVMGRSSGRYDVVPYVLAEGFAYTSRPYDPAVDGPMPDGIYYGGYGVSVAVQPRAVPAALALAPLTIGLAVFVGTWTMRTRFVR